MMDRVKTKEFKRNAVVAEIFQKQDANKTYFDVRILREFVADNTKKRGPYIQQRDVRDIIIVSALAQEWIASRHKEIREGNNQDFEKAYISDEEDEFREPGDGENSKIVYEENL